MPQYFSQAPTLKAGTGGRENQQDDPCDNVTRFQVRMSVGRLTIQTEVRHGFPHADNSDTLPKIYNSFHTSRISAIQTELLTESLNKV
jgi:hypothetical protein